MIKYLKFIKIFLAALIVFFIQIAVISSWGPIFSKINLILFFLIFSFIFFDFQRSFYFALFSGVFLDIFSFYPFGIYSLVLILSLLLIDFVSSNLFTNKSIYSFLILSFLYLVFYNFIIYLLIFIFENNLFGIMWFNKVFFGSLLLEIFWIFMGIVISFYFFNKRKRLSDGLSFEKSRF